MSKRSPSFPPSKARAAALHDYFVGAGTRIARCKLLRQRNKLLETIMGIGRGILLWLLGIPIPIIILLALFWR